MTGLPHWLSSEESACNAGDAGDMGLIPGLGRSPGRRHGNSLQYSAMDNPWTEDPGEIQAMELQRVGHD